VGSLPRHSQPGTDVGPRRRIKLARSHYLGTRQRVRLSRQAQERGRSLEMRRSLAGDQRRKFA
jgi:hypothetical protein